MAIFVTFFFLTFLLPCFGDHVLHTVTGEVSCGNYTYYTLIYEGPITLRLTTISGDTDLYVSQFLSKPTFDPKTYCLHSATCGVDVVHLPISFRRPIAIGIYGHSSYDTSRYSLDVILRERRGESSVGELIVVEDEGDVGDDSEFDAFLNEPLVDLNPDDTYRFREPSKRKVNFRYPENGESNVQIEDLEEESREEEPFLWNLLWSLMELIFEIFFL